MQVLSVCTRLWYNFVLFVFVPSTGIRVHRYGVIWVFSKLQLNSKIWTSIWTAIHFATHFKVNHEVNRDSNWVVRWIAKWIAIQWESRSESHMNRIWIAHESHVNRMNCKHQQSLTNRVFCFYLLRQKERMNILLTFWYCNIFCDCHIITTGQLHDLPSYN